MMKQVLTGLAVFIATFSFAQQHVQKTVMAPVAEASSERKPRFLFDNGVGIMMPDSIFTLNFRFRMQSRALYFTRSETDWGMARAEARIRRLRLRFQGFMLNPRLQYYIQLSFSRGDMDWRGEDMSSVNENPNVVRDAVIYYQPNEKITFIFGQTKLPGNRQRVVSSGELQFYDRSIVNATFNIDRDFGFQTYYHNHIGSFYYALKGALTTGDGRNVTSTPPGLAYTGRIELMPLGQFAGSDPILGGGYAEGDLLREETPKLALAGGMSYNEQARRSGGQTGMDIFELRDITTYFIDVLFKYNGFAFYSEYMERATSNPLTIGPDDAIRHIITGSGYLLQASYFFKNNFETAGRYATVIPNHEIRTLQLTEEVYTLGMTRYLRKHRVKLQGNISYQSDINTLQNLTENNWMVGFQMELGI